MRKITKLLIISTLFFAAAAPLYAKGVYILCYHAFLDKKDPYSFTPAQFKDQLVQLKNNGFQFVTFEDVVNDRITGNNNILISIDDGNKSVYQTYFEVMKPMGIKPLLGIYPAIINRQSYALDWEQLKTLSDDGCYIAAHGYHHMFLTEKYYNSDKAGFKKEIYLSKKVLEEKLGRNIEAMVYPFGAFSDIAISELKNAGYKYGMTIIAKKEELPVKDNFQINRHLMTKSAQKDIIARISKQSANAVAATAPVDRTNIQYDTEKKDTVSIISASVIPPNTIAEKKSIVYYPERIKQIISKDAFLSIQNNMKEPDNLNTKTIAAVNKTSVKKTNNKGNSKFEPFVHKQESSVQQKKNKKETTEKKNRKKKGKM